MKVFSPLRYPGGKAKLAPFVKTIFRANDLVGGHYVEPYAGGAGLALDLLINEYAWKIYLNDVDKRVYALWKACLKMPDELCRLIRDRVVGMWTWRRCRNIVRNYKDHSTPEVGFAFLFLNRTNRSGIVRGGVIGGNDQSGRWKIDARYTKNTLIERVQQIANYSKRIRISNMDAIKFLERTITTLPATHLIYCDPPYFSKGQRLYTNFYEPSDHVDVANFLKSYTETKWLVSYDPVPQIKKLYMGLRQRTYRLQYSASEAKEGKEIMFFSPALAHAPRFK